MCERIFTAEDSFFLCTGVTIQWVAFRKVLLHVFAKIQRHTSQNALERV